jgi:hypothetical protein
MGVPFPQPYFYFVTSFENIQELRSRKVDKPAGTTQIYVWK